MKSKPPTKKAKVDVSSASGTAVSSNLQATDGKPKAKILSAIKEASSSKAIASGLPTIVEVGSGTKSKAVGNILGNPVAGISTPPCRRLSYPTILIPEVSKEFQRISSLAVLSLDGSGSSSQTQSTFLPIDEVEGIQHELETLWSLLAIRSRTIKTESEILESVLGGQGEIAPGGMSSLLGDHYDANHQEKINTVKSIIESGHGTRTSVSAAAKLVLGTESGKGLLTAPSSSIVVGSNRKSNNSAAAATSVSIPSPTISNSARQPKKKLKAELGDKSKVGGNKPQRAEQNRSHSISMDESFLRLEAPNQFWEFADSYCRDLTKEDVDVLSAEVVEFMEIPDSTFSVPPLGKHFSGNENKLVDSNTRSREDRDRNGRDAVGPLTQRLVTALVEDRISQYSVQANIGSGGRDELNGVGGEFQLIPRPGLVKALGLDVTGPGTQITLEARLKMVLAEQGYLVGDESDDDPLNPDQGDEVLAEIKRTFATLRKLHKHNLEKLEKLNTAAKNELTRLPYKKELEKADRDIIAAYRAITACRIKRKPITQKERSIATKALQCRQHAVEKLSTSPRTAPDPNKQE